MSRPATPAPPADHVRHAVEVPKVVASAGVLLVTGMVARDRVPAWEQPVFRRLHEVPDWVDVVVWLPMQAGSAWAPPLVALAAAVGLRRWRPVAGALVVGWGGWLLAKEVKSLVGRARPAEVFPDLVRDSALRDGLGFISGHTTVAFGLACVVSPYLPRPWRVAAYGLATTVGVARIVVGAHLPLDVVGGAALGLLLGYLWNLIVGVPVVGDYRMAVS